ncbi:ATP-binding protein [Labedaea rhizosphaerae]|uniref:Putative ATPase n=1 Tax=Labedaea rhizosphaerae TaxID=598644 RepID=A0A4R6SGY1_LABRH|nr:LuxR C-terminal-related transcriptional regulator [Labedaea rhizosphaerae]TDQ00780.1 putative ATPase [Labedaea rhizosphaerae]
MTSATSVLRRPDRRLPSEVTSFVGRRRELAEVRRSLNGARLVTLTGIGGVGKTRLALHAAAGLRAAFPDGVWLAELGDLPDPDALADKIAAVFGLPADAGHPLAALTAFLADKRLLLVLDNCEHVLNACAALADRLLSTVAGLRVLATSRQPLELPGERTLPVGALAVPGPGGASRPGTLEQYDGIALFVDRARAIQPGFTLNERNYDLVVEVCRRLDGIPLAIELTAARLRSFSLAQLLDRLEDRYSLLTTGNRGAPKRQQTLQALMDWSYQLCTPEERTLWARLSVFTGGFELAAAEAVSGTGFDGTTIVDALAGLVDKSVVARTETDGRTRFWMLETIRRYGMDRLTEAGERDEVRRRHRDWFKDLVATAEAEWVGPNQVAWHRRFAAEGPNLRLALDYCLNEDGGQQDALEFATSLCVHGRGCTSLAEGRRWLDRVLAQVPEPTSARANALWVNGWLALLQGDCPAARVLLDEARALAQRLGDAPAMAYVVQFSALADLFDGEFAAAVDGFADAMRRHEEVGNPNGLRASALQRVMARCFAGDAVAAAAIKRTRMVLRPTPSPVTGAYLSWCDAIERFIRRDRGDASGPAMQALRIGADAGEQWLVALSMETLAWLAADAGEHLRAARLLGAAEAARQAIGTKLSGLAYLRKHHEVSERVARSVLGDAAFEAGYREGARMSESQAISFAAPGKPARQAPGRAARGDSALTTRELEIADLVARGLSNQEIADALVIARRTAETHVGHILAKLGFSARAQIAAWTSEHRPSAGR